MCNDKIRVFCLDNDSLEVLFKYDPELQLYFGEYPDFSEEPRFTPNGRPWVNTMYTDCPHSPENYNDCGSCRFFCRENPRDLIGICMNEELRKEQTP